MDKQETMAQFAEAYNFGDDSTGAGGNVPFRITKPSIQNVKRNLTSGLNALNKVRKLIPNVPQPIVDASEAAVNLWNQTPYGQLEQQIPQEILNISDKAGLPNPVSQGLSMAGAMLIPGPGDGMTINKVVGGLNKARRLSIKPNVTKNIPPNQVLQPELVGVNDGMMINPTQPLEARSLGGTGSTQAAQTAVNYRNQLGEFLERESLNLKELPSKTIKIKGKEQRIPLSPYSIEELLPKVQEYLNIREKLGIKQPRKGWQSVFGNILDEQGFPIDLQGGRSTSKVPLSIRKQKGSFERWKREFAWNQDETSLSARRAYNQWLNNKHHVKHLTGSEVFTHVKDPKGGFKPRPPSQLKNVERRLEKDGILLGNKDLNEVMQSRLAHLGSKDNPLGIYGSHPMMKGVTDNQGFVKGEVFEGGKPRPGTYSTKRGHGFSDEAMSKLANITNDDDLYEAIKLFYEVTDEAYKGTAKLASDVIDAGFPKDELTRTLLQSYAPEARNFYKALLKLPQFKNDPRILNAMLKNNKDQYVLDLIKDSTRKLKPIPTSNGRRHISK